MDVQDIVIKHTQPLRVAEAVGTTPGFGNENLGPVFGQLLPEVLGCLERAGARPGISVAHYDEPADEGIVAVHAGFDIGEQDVPDNEHVRVGELPIVAVASVVHRGSMAKVVPIYEALVRWIEDSGYHIAGRSRELYHEWHDEDPTRNVTELQLPIGS